jgi:hypothetical protein
VEVVDECVTGWGEEEEEEEEEKKGIWRRDVRRGDDL